MFPSGAFTFTLADMLATCHRLLPHEIHQQAKLARDTPDVDWRTWPRQHAVTTRSDGSMYITNPYNNKDGHRENVREIGMWHVAAAQGRADIINAMYRANLNPPDSGRAVPTLFAVAFARGEAEVVQALLDTGLVPSKEDFDFLVSCAEVSDCCVHRVHIPAIPVPTMERLEDVAATIRKSRATKHKWNPISAIVEHASLPLIGELALMGLDCSKITEHKYRMVNEADVRAACAVPLSADWHPVRYEKSPMAAAIHTAMVLQSIPDTAFATLPIELMFAVFSYVDYEYACNIALGQGTCIGCLSFMIVTRACTSLTGKCDWHIRHEALRAAGISRDTSHVMQPLGSTVTELDVIEQEW